MGARSSLLPVKIAEWSPASHSASCAGLGANIWNYQHSVCIQTRSASGRYKAQRHRTVIRNLVIGRYQPTEGEEAPECRPLQQQYLGKSSVQAGLPVLLCLERHPGMTSAGLEVRQGVKEGLQFVARSLQSRRQLCPLLQKLFMLSTLSLTCCFIAMCPFEKTIQEKKLLWSSVFP